jgi:restriction endonuclease Mrr
MTFYEAALRVLEAAGQPLTFGEITERSVAQGLLSHVGKTPEQTMLSRLVAMARRARDRRVVVTGPDTFGLIDWNLPEDAAALETMSQPFEHPEEGLPPLRPPERHPEPRGERGRAAAWQESKRRRYPPISEVAFELLGEADAALAPAALLALARQRQLASEELQPEALLTALAEDNQRRIDGSRRPHFALSSEGALMLEHDDAPVAEVQAAFARALNLPWEDGHIHFQSPAAEGPGPTVPAVDETVVHAAKSSVKEARRAMARTLRAYLASLEGRTFEKACVRMLHALGFREVKVAKRGKEGLLLTARRKDGSLELRWAVRLLRGGGVVDRRGVQECRREVGHQAAHVGLLLGTGEVRGEARAEALSGGPLVQIWSGEGLAEKFLEAHAGVRVTTLELFELDRAFFEDAARDAEDARRRREERHRERESAPPALARAGQEPSVREAEEVSGVEVEGEVEGGEAAAVLAEAGSPEATPAEAAASERKRRRRRRRGRRGRPRPGGEGAAGTPAEGPASVEGQPSSDGESAADAAPPPGNTPPGD